MAIDIAKRSTNWRRHTLCLLVTFTALTALMAGPALAEDPPDEDWHGKLDFNVNANFGTTDSLAGGIHGEAKKVWDPNELEFVLDAAYGFTSDNNGDSLTADSQILRGGYKRFLDDLISDRVYWFLDGQVGRNNIQDIQWYALADTGLGWRVWEADDVKKNYWDLEAGVGYRFDNYQVPSIMDTLEDRSLVNGRISTDVRKALGAVEVGADAAFYLPFNETPAWFFNASAFIDVPLAQSWKFNVRGTLNYLNDPPDSADNTNLLLQLGLGYAF